jgi:hypothetical protein
MKGSVMPLLRSRRALVALVCACAWLGAVRGAEKSAASMADAATAFLSALTPEQRQKAAFTFDEGERLKWHFIPTEMFARNGLIVGDMTEKQRALAHALLQAGLSQRGYLTATAIMDLETVLNALESAARQANPGGRGNVLVRDPVRYFFSIFGTPSPRGAWGWRVEGHHVSLNFTVVNGSLVASSPAFFGSNPAEVREGPKKGLRILAAQEDAARALLMALDASQRTQAVVNAAAPNDISTMNTLDITPLSPAGITADRLTPAQRTLLMAVVEAYTGVMAADIAAERMDRIRKSGVEKIAFAWAGAAERGQRHYYRVQGPTFLIEYDNTQNNANHIHSVWRDFQGDFGRDLLRDHLRSVAH